MSAIDRLQSKLDKRQEERESFGGANSFVSVPFGDSWWFILPGVVNGQFDMNSDFSVEVSVHFGLKYAGEDKATALLCSKAKYGTCPICDRAEQFKAAGDKETYDEIRAKKFYLYNVLDKDFHNKVLSTKMTQADAIDAEILALNKTEGVFAYDLNNGRQIYLNRIKTSPWCTARAVNKPIAFNTQHQQTIAQNCSNLTEMYDDFSPEELAMALAGTLKRRKKDEQQGQVQSAPQTQYAAPTAQTGATQPQVTPAPAPTPVQQPLANTSAPTGVVPQTTTPAAPVQPQVQPAPVQQSTTAPVASQPAPVQQNVAPTPAPTTPASDPNAAPFDANEDVSKLSADEIMARLNG